MSLDVYFRDDIVNILLALARANPHYHEALACVAQAFGMDLEFTSVKFKNQPPILVVLSEQLEPGFR